MAEERSLSFIIRDGVVDDVDNCLELDHGYETAFVWQFGSTKDDDVQRYEFRRQRLPRPVEFQYPAQPERLTTSLEDDQCFLVAIGKYDDQMLGYLAMRKDIVHQTAHIHTLLVSRPLRRKMIASRLLRIAIQWAKEQELKRLFVEIQATNYPGILFCQNSGFTLAGFNDRYFGNHDVTLFWGRSI